LNISMQNLCNFQLKIKLVMFLLQRNIPWFELGSYIKDKIIIYLLIQKINLIVIGNMTFV